MDGVAKVLRRAHPRPEVQAMSDYVKPQPAPEANDSRPVWPLVVEDCEGCARVLEGTPSARIWRLLADDGKARDSFGNAKYGVRLGVNPAPRDAAVDAYQEALDGCVYWMQEVEKTDSPEALSLYNAALELAFNARAYLLKRDGK